ncbi:MAG: VWA-like domain-containing protein [Lachnospiraceae bacterium]
MHIQTQEEWEEEKAKKILNLTRDEIYVELRFLDVALSALLPQADTRVQTFATDGEVLYFSALKAIECFQKNPQFLTRLYLHTLLHCIFSHLWIRQSRDKNLWSIACDIAVEYTIDHLQKQCTKRALTLRRRQIYTELEKEENGISAAQIYHLLRQKTQEEYVALQMEFYTDDHRFWPQEKKLSARQQQTAQNWQKIARQSSLSQKRRGKESKKGEALLQTQMKVEKSRRSYTEFLRKFAQLHEEMHCDLDEFDLNYYMFGLEHYGNMPLIEPLETQETMKIQEFVIVVDTSYSTNGKLVENFLRETTTILLQKQSFFTTARIHILQCDDKVRMDTVVTCDQDVERLLHDFTVTGGGSTDFRPAFIYVNDLIEKGEIKNLRGLLYFTDGKGIYPKVRPNYQVAFLFLDAYEKMAVPPWAMQQQILLEELMETNR